MSLRWRADGRLLCAAMTEAEDGDTYIDDRLHYHLSVIPRAVIADVDHETTPCGTGSTEKRSIRWAGSTWQIPVGHPCERILKAGDAMIRTSGHLPVATSAWHRHCWPAKLARRGGGTGGVMTRGRPD